MTNAISPSKLTDPHVVLLIWMLAHGLKLSQGAEEGTNTATSKGEKY